MIIDSHCHLSDPRLADQIGRIHNELKSFGIESVFEVGYDLQSSASAVELSEKYDDIFAIVGTHPHDAKSFDDDSRDFYVKAAAKPKTVAIGEIGLDYYYDLSPRQIQKEVFAAQIALAHEVGLPIVLHVRDAYKDACDVLSACSDMLTDGVLLHCYSSSAEMLKQFNKFDCYYALGGAITFKNAKKDDVISAIPEERLLVETDCPYMTPVPYRGQPNEPKYVNMVIDKIAQVRGVSRERLIEIVNLNTRRLFTKYDR